MVAVVGWCSIGSVDYVAIVEVVYGTVCLTVALLVIDRNCGKMRRHCLLEVAGIHRCNGSYMCICRNVLLALAERDFARIVDSKRVTSKTPFAADVAVVLKC
ncbi:hypothetical protein PIB30_088051 [Stylosanthes scabra]|uniref:Secreted protein n=1 Tax=Stylosanthes scabra TaxID=79078 RepID=A0ABU6WTM4_9FABA|nr:hypothetical protein [Stylosanthes scabra]